MQAPDRLSRRVRLEVEPDEDDVGLLGHRARQAELEVAELVAAQRDAREIVALHEDPGPAERPGEVRSLDHRRRPDGDRHARDPGDLRANLVEGRAAGDAAPGRIGSGWSCGLLGGAGPTGTARPGEGEVHAAGPEHSRTLVTELERGNHDDRKLTQSRSRSQPMAPRGAGIVLRNTYIESLASGRACGRRLSSP